MSVRFIRKDEILIPASGTTVGGTLVEYNGKARLFSGMKTAAEGEMIALTGGVTVRVPKATATTFAAGAAVEYDIASGLAVAASGGDFHVGTAIVAVVDGDSYVDVELNEPAPA
jgi:hypothetical protein